jgi:hypothetical protein
VSSKPEKRKQTLHSLATDRRGKHEDFGDSRYERAVKSVETLLPGTSSKLGVYAIIRDLGDGSFGKIKRQSECSEFVAPVDTEALSPGDRSWRPHRHWDQSRSQVYFEGECLRRLSHPHIAKLFLPFLWLPHTI